MPRTLVNRKNHLFGFDDETGKYFIVEVKNVPLKAVDEGDLVAWSKAVANGTAIIWEDPEKGKKTELKTTEHAD
jgi:hypothetical protein